MKDKSIKLNSREAILLHVAIRGLAGSYLMGSRNEDKSEAERAKSAANCDECRELADKIANVFGMVSATLTNDDGTEESTIFFGKHRK